MCVCLCELHHEVCCFSFWNRGRGTDYLIHVYSVLMPDEEGGRGRRMDGWRSRFLHFFLLVFGFGFSSGRVQELEELGVRVLSFGLGVAFVLVRSDLSSWL